MNTTTTHLLHPLLLAASLLLGGCAIRADLPDDFLRLDGPGREVKALTPDDARLWVREFTNHHDGSLDYCTRALRNDLVDGRGYLPREDGVTDTADAADVAGTVQVFDVTRNAIHYRYLIAVFVDGDRIRTAEFLAPRERFDELEADLRATLRTLDG